jgi:GPH family glycoside/pentoside/hexuronide:cation symporter
VGLGAALALSWWAEAIANPLAGYISDKYPTRWGRRTPWLIVGSPLMALGFSGIFLYPANATEILPAIMWVAVFLIIFKAAYGATVCVYLAMIPEIAPTPVERNSISSWRQLFYLIGTIGGTLIGMLFESEVVFTYILAMFMIVCFYIAAFGSKEPRIFTKTVSEFNIVKEITQTLKNKPFLPYVGFTIFATAMSTIVIGSLALFGREVVYHGEENFIASILPALFVITAIIGVVPSYYLINRVGKRKATMIGLIVIAILLSLLFTVGMFPGLEPIQALGLVLLIGFPAALLLILPDSIISDITDYDEAITGSRREAMHFATQGIFTRFAGGLASAVMGVILGIFGQQYAGESIIQEIAPSLPSTFGLSLIGPIAAICALIGLVSIYFYPEAEVLEKTSEKG